MKTDDKKVCCLYRTKTLTDSDKSEMELQRKACHDFAQEHNWFILREFWQAEVPNDDVALDTDDALIELRAGAAKGKFDILLAYELDRLGRTPYESPFAAAFFDHSGIEIWTAKGGQQDFTSFWDIMSRWVE